MNKEPIEDQSKANRVEFNTPFLRLKAIERKLCQSNEDKKLGYSNFLGENMNMKNLSANSIDSASKAQAKAVRTLDSLAKRPLADLLPTIKKEGGVKEINSIDSVVVNKTKENILNERNDSVVSIVPEKAVEIPDSPIQLNNKILNDTSSFKLVQKKEDSLKNQPEQDKIFLSIDSSKTHRDLAVLKGDLDGMEWRSAVDFYRIELKNQHLDLDSSSTTMRKNLPNFILKDSLFNFFHEMKHPDFSGKGEESTDKTTNRKKGASGNVFVQFIAVDAITHRVLDRPDIKLYRGKTRRNYRFIFSDTIHGARIEFQNTPKLIVKAKVFGYLPFEEIFDTLACYRFHDTIYDFLFMKPVQKGDILDLPNVYFYPNTTVLKQSSCRELDKLVDFMNANSFKVRVNGHTQGNKRIVNNGINVAPESKFKGTALRLSKKRADRVLQYLLEKGIDKKRISTRGYAGRKPKIKHPKNKAEREMNMRVEVEILK